MNEIIIPLKLASDCVLLKLNWIPPGRFVMGDQESPGFDEWTDTPIGEFEVILTRGYWMGIYPVTLGQWQAVMGTHTGYYKAANHPVVEVSWQDSLDFCSLLDISPLPIPQGYIFSLPTEVQWEYACRAGTTFHYQIGDSLNDLSRVAWHNKNVSQSGIQDVGQKEPNHWGLYDMLGNVLEWCFDSPVDYPDGTTRIDWFGGRDSDSYFLTHNRIARGGCSFMGPDNPALKCSYRTYGFDPHEFFGFRLCLRYGDLTHAASDNANPSPG